MERVFKRIHTTRSRAIVSRGFHEIKIDCEDKIEILDYRPVLADHERGKVYFDGEPVRVEKISDEWID